MASKERIKQKIQFRGNKDSATTLTIDDLDDLVYSSSQRAANKATTDLYKGLSKAYFNRWDEDNRMLMEEMGKIIVRLDQMQAKLGELDAK